MNDHAVALSLAHAFDGAPGLAGCQLVAHDVQVIDGEESRPEEITLPAVLIHSKSESLSSSATVARATVEIAIESQSDDDTSATHSARVTAARDRMTDMNAISAAFTGRGITLIGRPAPTQTDPDVEQRAFRTVLTYRIGYQSA